VSGAIGTDPGEKDSRAAGRGAWGCRDRGGAGGAPKVIRARVAAFGERRAGGRADSAIGRAVFTVARASSPWRAYSHASAQPKQQSRQRNRFEWVSLARLSFQLR